MASSKARPAFELLLPACEPERTAETPYVRDAVLAVFDSCSPGLVRYVRSFGIPQACAQDVVQEVFLALFRHLRAGRPDHNLKGWAYRVAHNLALKHRRTLRRRGDVLQLDNGLIDMILDPALNPEQTLAETQRRARLTTVLHGLPELDRQCLLLRAEGLRYRDIAGVLGVSLGFVSKSLGRSLARLADV